MNFEEDRFDLTDMHVLNTIETAAKFGEEFELHELAVGSESLFT